MGSDPDVSKEDPARWLTFSAGSYWAGAGGKKKKSQQVPVVSSMHLLLLYIYIGSFILREGGRSPVGV